MEGTLRKFVEQVKFFQMSVYPKRYFVIDFTLACVQIRDCKAKDKGHLMDLEKTQKVIPFRDVTDCYLPKGEIDKANLPKNWSFPFYVQTTERVYVLCAKNVNERNMWMAGFRYVIASTLTVQCIMKHNNQVLDKKLKQKTEAFVKKQVESRQKKKKSEKEFSDTMYSNLVNKDGVSFWKSWKDINSSHDNATTRINGATNAKDIADTFATYFESVYRNHDTAEHIALKIKFEEQFNQYYSQHINDNIMPYLLSSRT